MAAVAAAAVVVVVEGGILTQRLVEAAILRGKLGDSVLAGPPYDSFICHTVLLSIPLSASGMFMNISADMI